MSNLEGVFSLRVVIADFYMAKPTYGLDPCISEFRGNEIRSVPIIRIFGSNSMGQKTCMHVHGVFPYFYIPYEKKDFESINKAIYQIALNVDKAINISLGQGSSGAQHIFKIQLVKGIPFYGYHRADHQFLKIHMFNPRFVRRAANLLQNGAILNKVFHPHESHVPYILQFMIDYNLYGMSLLHVPLEVVKFRRKSEDEAIKYTGVQPKQILSTLVAKKQSSSALEVDIASNFILNRFQVITKSNSTHSNPGIEAIWNDEKIRREKLSLSLSNDADKINEIPALEVPETQERPNVMPADSEIFYRTALLTKLLAMETSLLGTDADSDRTINCTLQSNVSVQSTNPINLSNVKDQKRTFNLKKLLLNAVYPEECSQNDFLMNASFIENHLPTTIAYQATPPNQNISSSDATDESIFLNDTIVDEKLVLSLTQLQHVPLNSSLRKEDFQLLDVLEQLEENNINKDHIDLDSSLAPLSQDCTIFELSPELLDKQTAALITNPPTKDNDYESDQEDDENINDFTMVMDDIDEIILKFTQSQPSKTNQQLSTTTMIPQIDGSDDVLNTPKKSVSKNRFSSATRTLHKSPPHTPKNHKKTASGSPLHSPRTPKSNYLSKYAPLPMIISNKSEKINSTENISRLATATTMTKNNLEENNNLKSNTVINSLAHYTSRNNRSQTARRSRRIKDLDKTHITCALTPLKTNERKLKVNHTDRCIDSLNEQIVLNKTIQVSNSKSLSNKCTSSVRRSIRTKTDNLLTQVICQDQLVNNITPTPSDKKDKKKSINETQITVAKLENDIKQSVVVQSIDNGDDECIIETDTELNKSITISLKTPNSKRLRRSTRSLNKRKQPLNEHDLNVEDEKNTSSERSPKTSPNAKKYFKSVAPTKNVAINYPSLAKSFDDNLFSVNSPPVFSDASIHSPVLSVKSTPISISAKYAQSSDMNFSIIIKPLILPPSYDEVMDSCDKFEIFEHEFQKPFYSNPQDITNKKEVGDTVLSIQSNKLNDCEEFQSVLDGDLKTLNDWRKKQLLNVGGLAILNRYRNAQRIREYFATQKCIVIAPQINAPSKHDSKLWLKARELMNNRCNEYERVREVADDSPIKVRRQKVTMMFNDEGNSINSGDEEMNILNLTPLSPINTENIRNKNTIQNKSCAPLSKQHFKVNLSRQCTKHISKRSTLPLKKKSKDLSVETSNSQPDFLLKENEIKCVDSKNLLISDNDSCGLNKSQKNFKNSHSGSTSISSQSVMAALDQPSFIKNLQMISSGEHEISFGLSSADLNNTFGFKLNLENLQQAKSDIQYTYLTTITLELFILTRDDLCPNPEIDEIRCIFYAIENSMPAENQQTESNKSCGYIIVHDHTDLLNREGKRHGIDFDVKLKVVTSELEAIHALLELCSIWDPDIYAGYEIEMGSWGYLIERAKFLNLNIMALLSRMPQQKVYDFVDEDRDQFTDLNVEMKLCGRILLDVWRLMRSEIALTSYTFENVMYHIMHKRCPWHSYRDLTMWFTSSSSRWIVIEYFLERVRGTLTLLHHLDVIGRTSEMAKLIGIQFYEVLSRGSQFRVESMMLRIAKPKNLVPLSPSVQQRAHMRAPEYLALIMEPLSRFYSDPVIVLDFQSLYPSMIIAYNYCFSTCLGRVEHLGQSTPFEFGASQLRVSPTMLKYLLDQDLITISPCGVVFVKSKAREGILPRMLQEILDTRQMVKQSMKLYKTNPALQRVLHSRQLGLKLMANVTYGYTAANFSGRMPSVEVGDSVVSKGRETLEQAVKMVEENKKWNVKVVYGDTDSMFVLVPGRNRSKAFEIGAEIAEAITKANPQPVKLKLEKVYQPCILQTKKRYVGYMYETVDQAEPVYEAKGIETVRRDGCPAVPKMLEKVLRVLFDTADVSQVKNYVCRQFTKLLSGRANLQDLIFAKEFRGLNGYKPTACVPALELTRKWIQSDPRRIPRRGERVPFVIANGPPGVPLISLVRSPHEVLADEGLKINSIYYITKAIIPPLNRCLLLIGADANDWFTNLPRTFLAMPALAVANDVISTASNAMQLKKSTISQYFSTTNCVIDCGRQTKNGICSMCEKQTTKSITVLCNKIAKIDRGYHLTEQICQSCCGRIGNIKCGSLDCPVLYVMEAKRRDLSQISHLRNLIAEKF